MKVIVAGGRDFNNYQMVCDALKDLDITEIVCGRARGADTLGEQYGKEFDKPIKYFNPDWENQGRAAGIIRNHQMGDYADYLVAFWDGKSRGTKDMIEYMRSIGKHGKVIFYEN